jgi:hypothetical protein
MAAELHFAIGHLAISPAQDFLKIEGNGPEIGGTTTKSTRIEIRRALPEASPGRSNTAMREIVHGDGMAQGGFRIFVEQTQEAMQFFVAKLLQLFADLVELPIGPIFDALEPLAAPARL